MALRRLGAICSHLSPPSPSSSPSPSFCTTTTCGGSEPTPKGPEFDWKDYGAYPYQHVIQTRWGDQDCYGHMNNKEYYSFIDTIVNKYLIEEGGLDISNNRGSAAVGYVVRSECDFLKPIKFLEEVKCGMKVERLGTSSVTYRVGLFTGSPPTLCALGRFVHVFVGPEERPVPINPKLRKALNLLL